MTAADLQSWHDYFVTVAQAGATLAGLLFVGLTISLGHVINARGYLARGFTALALQFEILVLGLFALVPGQSPAALGVEFICTGLFVLAGTQAFARSFPEDERSQVLSGRGPRAVRFVLTSVATLFPALAGLGLCRGWPYALYLQIPAVLAAIYLSIGYAWVFAVEIPRRKEEESRKP
ncbi:MAG TPA: hypothetical protein VMH86_08145 [Rhizomicrobium sp.]|nr:hypothetical protein [Rhizomicrobium sp.]